MLLSVGASFTAFTVTETVAGEEVVVPSDTVKVKLSDPLKLDDGVYVTVEPLKTALPLDGFDVNV